MTRIFGLSICIAFTRTLRHTRTRIEVANAEAYDVQILHGDTNIDGIVAYNRHPQRASRHVETVCLLSRKDK